MTEKLVDRQARLKARIESDTAALEEVTQKLKDMAKKEDSHFKIVVGGAIIKHARSHPRFYEWLRNYLDLNVKRDHDRRVVKKLLPPPPSQEDNDPGSQSGRS